MEVLTFIVLATIGIAYVAWCNIVGRTAEKKGRDGLFWFFFAFLLSPLLGMLFVAFLSETDSHRRKRIEEEERIRRKVWDNDKV